MAWKSLRGQTSGCVRVRVEVNTWPHSLSTFRDCSYNFLELWRPLEHRRLGVRGWGEKRGGRGGYS